MLNIKFITVGTLKEQYLRDAVAEYSKRLNGFCKPEFIVIKESKLSDDPSEKEIASALDNEAEAILSAIPQRAYVFSLCIEGKQLSSAELSEKIETVCSQTSDICFIIGSSFGLSDKVKNLSDMRLSFSKLTFPHQLMKVILLEAVYRALNISKGTKYHK